MKAQRNVQQPALRLRVVGVGLEGWEGAPGSPRTWMGFQVGERKVTVLWGLSPCGGVTEGRVWEHRRPVRGFGSCGSPRTRAAPAEEGLKSAGLRGVALVNVWTRNEAKAMGGEVGTQQRCEWRKGLRRADTLREEMMTMLLIYAEGTPSKDLLVGREHRLPKCTEQTHPLMISLVSARMKCSFSGVRMHRENFWPVRPSPSTTSVHWFMLMVP